MTADIGSEFWTAQTFQRDPWLDGHELTNGFQVLSMDPADPLVLLPTLGGTHIAQGLALGTTDPIARVAYKFQATADPEGEEDHFLLRRAMLRGALCYFVPFYWVEEVVTAVSGTAYKLSRPAAWGLVTDCDSTSYPAKYYLDGTLTPGCATLSGQTLTAAATGEITVRYLPAFRVKVYPTFSISEPNAIVTQYTLQEGIVLS